MSAASGNHRSVLSTCELGWFCCFFPPNSICRWGPLIIAFLRLLSLSIMPSRSSMLLQMAKFLNIYFFLDAVGVCCCTQPLSSCSRWRLLSMAAYPVAEHGCAGFRACGSQAQLPAECRVFLDQGSNLCPLRWQTDSQPLQHQGILKSHFLWLNNIAPCVYTPCVYTSLSIHPPVDT